MRLLGRDLEIAAVARALAEVEAGGHRSLAVSGEAGIGKSALLAVAAERASAAELLVLSGRAAEHEQDLPFGLLRDAVGDRLDPFPAPAPEEPVIPWERFRLHHALRARLERLADERPVALLLDDVQWADEATVELLLHLLRRPPRGGFLLLFALRPGSVLTRLLDAGRRADGWDELRPAPLSRRSARALLPDDLDAAVRERILHEADGNPLFLRELARGSGAAGDPDEPVPGTVAAAIAQELDRLSPAARAFAAGAAVAGDPFELDVATAAAALTEADAIAALDELVAADLVRAAGGRSFGFRHPLVHRAVADSTASAWRLEAHARAAALLERRGASPALRAYHVEQFAHPGDSAAIAVLRAAGAETAATSPAASADWFGAALKLAPEEDAALRAELLERRGLALGAAGAFDDSRAALDACIALLAPEEGDRRATLLAAVSTADVLLGEYGAAERRIEAALADAAAPLRPRLLSLRAGLAFLKGDGAAVAGWAARAEQALALLPDDQPAVRAAIASQHAFGQVLLGEPAGERVEQAARLLEQADDATVAAQVDAAWTVGGNLSQVERYAAAAPVLRRGLRLARNSLQAHLYLHLHVVLAMAELPLLELDAALERLEVAEEATRLQGRRYELAFALTQKARVLAARGQREEAEQAAFDSELLIGSRAARGATVTLLAHNALVRHGRDPRQLLRELERAAGPRLRRLNRTAAGSVLLAATRAAIAADALDEAEAWAAQASAVAGGLDLPATAVRAVRAEAELLLARDDADEAARLARRAAADALRHGLRQEQLGAELLAGRAELAAGERDAAIARLQSVAATAGRLGAFADRDEAARALRRAGARVSMGAQRAADAAGRSDLSERELEVAELVARGASNRQVAVELHLSEKTVERHLSHVYAKLGIDGRGELSAALGG